MDKASLVKALEDKFKKHPHSFWAKKFDTVVHLTQSNPHQTLCGSSAALLGNNYAPVMPYAKICDRCVNIQLERQAVK